MHKRIALLLAATAAATAAAQQPQRPDPGWYKHPAGTVAYEWQGEAPRAERRPATGVEEKALKARKPSGRAGH